MPNRQFSLFQNDDDNTTPYILISIREDIHEKILQGQKFYEYRRKFISVSSKVFVYVSGKSQAICSYAEFGEPIFGTIKRIIEINAIDHMPNPKGIYEYFRNRSVGFAIPIKKYQLIRPIPLKELRKRFEGFSPPQSYIFLEKKPELLRYLLEIKESKATVYQK